MLSEPEQAASNTQRWLQRLLWVGCSLFAAFLGILVFLGSTSRFLQDDYCFSVILSQKSLVDIYLHETTFSGNRFMLVVATSLSEWLGAWSVQALPGFLLFMWVIGLTLSLRQVIMWLVAAGKIKRVLWPGTVWLLTSMVAEIIVFLSLYAAPNRVQDYYWRAGSLTYLAPLVVFSFLVWWIIRSLQRPRPSLWAGLLTLMLAFAAAGFSETAAVFQIGGLALASVIAFFVHWVVRKVNRQAVWQLAVAWAGSLAAVVILLSSPANAPRFAGSYQAPPNLWNGIWGALGGAILFVKLTFYWLPVTALFVFVFFVLLSCAVQSGAGIEFPSGKGILFGLVGVVLTAYLCIAASMFPGFYIESSYPADRALLTARWISMMSLAGLGWLLGSSLRFVGKLPGFHFVPLFASVVLFGMLAVMLMLAPTIELREASFPEIREFAASHTVLVLAGMLAVLAAAALLSWLSARQPGAATGLIFFMILFAVVQPVNSSRIIFSEVPQFQARAILWDRRDAQIRQMAAAGQQEITIQALDSLAGIGELHDDTDFWVNRCAAWYYQVKTIRAVEPVMTLP